MSVTAVPLRPIKKGSVAKLWIGLALLSAAAGGIAWAGTASQQVTRTASGLEFRVIEEGEGTPPGPNDMVLVEYTGRTTDGKVFDTTEGQQARPFPVSGVIPGWSEGLQLMKKGGRYFLRVPPELGYGATGTPGGEIPPNSTLEFDVHLVDVATEAQIRAAQQQQMMQQMMSGGGGSPPGAEAIPGGPPGGGR